ncbi:TerD family protein [Streptomyces sp. NBC_00094]|uniref:TerD family protein n=1 Tax=Streptomyces sp. NBC_00094 TaxID=2903620 RepID=UPI002256F94F|nr:TerD family protein [Streptomyces sp. NBC_00094]MCX5390568.1 TerD family protein [Streptomyces sp. NBC_00094]
MGHLVKNKGYWVPSVALRVRIPGAEAAALLLDGSGRVRGDADLVFDGQPSHPSGAVRLGPSDIGLDLDLNEVEPAIERIVVAGWSRHGGFGEPPVLDAVAPDGSTVLSYAPSEAPDMPAVAVGVFYREAGGWKFDGVGEGYGAGLAGLVTAYGVEVTEDERVPVLGPVRLTGVVKVPGQVPAPGGYVPGLFPPLERPYHLVEGWEFGEVFEPFTAEGHGHQVITVDPSPSGPVLVELAHEGEGYVSLFPLNKRNKDEDFLFASALPDHRGSKILQAPSDRPLRFRITATGRWVLRVKPVAAARRIENVLHGYGAEALLYTGGVADLRVDFFGTTEIEGGYASLSTYEVKGRTSVPSDDRLLFTSNGRMRRSVPLSAGPLVLRYFAAGPWTLTVGEVDPDRS